MLSAAVIMIVIITIKIMICENGDSNDDGYIDSCDVDHDNLSDEMVTR